MPTLKRYTISLWTVCCVALAAFSGCSRSDLGGVSTYEEIIKNEEQKIINTKSASAEGTLLVEFAGVIPSLTIPENVVLEQLFPRAEDGMGRWYIARFSEEIPVDVMAREFAARTDVTRVQYDKILAAAPSHAALHAPSVPVKADGAVFDDPMLPEQWHMVNSGDKTHCTSAVEGADIAVKDAWALAAGDPSIVVAVLDYGVMYSHPDLAANMWVNEAELGGQEGVDDDGNGFIDDIYGFNFNDNGALSWNADQSHGTHVAGTVAAVNNNGIGVSSVAGGTGKGDGVRIMSCQIFSSRQSTSSVMARAFKYAADNGASIAQCSFGYEAGTFTDEADYRKQCAAEYNAIQYFLDKAHNNSKVLDGNIMIVSAGNDSKPAAGFPGALKDVVGVTAFGPGFQPSGYTNFGPGCNISAPGGDFYAARPQHNTFCQVLSTVPTSDGAGYGWLEGTSMAAPHVSGVAALGLSYATQLGLKFTREEFISMLLTSVNDIDRYCTGTKPLDASKTMNLADYAGKMGTGAVDAWKLLMQIEGTPSVQLSLGRQTFDVAEAAGDPAHVLKSYSVTMDEASRASLGISGELSVTDGKVVLECTKVGSGKMVITADSEGLPVTKTVSVICRAVTSSNGGWL